MLLTAAAAGRRRVLYPLPAKGAEMVNPPMTAGVHPSVVDMGTKWAGYRWWKADTPYPNSDVTLENPCITASNDRIVWHVPDGLTNPLDPYPGSPRFNSDTELVYDPESGRMVCYWRETGGLSLPHRYYAATSADGVAWTHEGIRLEVPLASAANMSPAIARAASGDWRLWNFADGGNPMDMYTAPTALGPWTLQGAVSWSGGPLGRHGSVILYQGQWLAYISDALSKPRAAISTDDGMTWIGALDNAPPPGPYAGYRLTFRASTEPGSLDAWGPASYWRVPDSYWLDLTSTP